MVRGFFVGGWLIRRYCLSGAEDFWKKILNILQIVKICLTLNHDNKERSVIGVVH